MADIRIPTIWNTDEERMKSLLFYLTLCDIAFTNWDLEGIYSNLHSIKRILFAKFCGDNEYEKLDEDSEINKKEKYKFTWQELERLKRKLSYLNDDREYGKVMIEYYNVAEKIYMKLNVLMKQHGIFFREGLDPRRAALRT